MQGIDDVRPKAWAIRNVDFKALLLLFLLFAEHLVVAAQTRFAFRLTAFGVHAHPLQLSLEGFAALARLLFFLL